MTTSALRDPVSMPSLYASRKNFEALPATPVRARVFDGAAMSLLPRITAAMGYRFRSGATPELRRDAAFVVTTVLGEDGLLPPSDIAHFGQRYDDATTWVVAYRGSLPVGALAIMDPRQASLGLDLMRREAPAGLRMERTRELGRLSVLRHHQGAPCIVVGLLLEAVSWAIDHDVNHFFAAANASFEGMLRAVCPSAQPLLAQETRTPNPIAERYFRKTREFLGTVQLVAFDVARTAPWRLMWRLLLGRLHGLMRPLPVPARARLHVVRA